MADGRRSAWRALGPGLLVAATGVGAGDLATGALSGSRLGLGCLWAVLVGALFKYVLTEGLARWQLATGETLLEGAIGRLGRPVAVLFPLYLLPWSYFTGAALISACGVAGHALFPLFEDPGRGKVVFGVLHSALGLVLVRRGGYRLFGKIMSVSIAVMFVTVVVSACLLRPDLGEVLRGLSVPRLPGDGTALGWTVALVGGVGGTLTVLCYGYWIREEGREGLAELPAARVDLAVGYLVTAIFGIAMVVIGSTVATEGRGATLVVDLANRLEEPLGKPGRLLFLVGAWGAVFSSLLGVWQAVPLIFADTVRLIGGERGPGGGTAAGVALESTPAYRGFLLALAVVPCLGLLGGFAAVQKIYAVVGAAFLPLLAVVLLILNGRGAWVGQARNGPASVALLALTLAFFVLSGWLGLR